MGCTSSPIDVTTVTHVCIILVSVKVLTKFCGVEGVLQKQTISMQHSF
jgi:hypothetical protein